MNPGTTCIFYQVCCGDSGFASFGVKFSENHPQNSSLNKKEKKTICQKVGILCYFSSLSCTFYLLNCNFLNILFLVFYMLLLPEQIVHKLGTIKHVRDKSYMIRIS